MQKTPLPRSVVFLFAMIFISACGGKQAGMADMPAYPGATELKSDENRIADTLKSNQAQDAAMRQALNVGGKIEQRGYTLPRDASWADVQGFYAERLKGTGWTSGLQGVAGQFVDVNKMMSAATSASPVQTALFTKGSQSLTLVYLVDPLNKDHRQLILSLATN